MNRKGAGGVDRRRRGIGFVICTFAEKMQIREPRDTDCHTSAAALVRNDGNGNAAARSYYICACARFLRDLLPANVRTKRDGGSHGR